MEETERMMSELRETRAACASLQKINEELSAENAVLRAKNEELRHKVNRVSSTLVRVLRAQDESGEL